MPLRKRDLMAAVSFLLILLSMACVFPEKFTMKVSVRKDRTYSLEYEGILTFVPAKAAARQGGRLNPGDERQVSALKAEFLKDPNFRRVDYKGNGEFEVTYKRAGKLVEPVYFLSRDISILSIAPSNNAQVLINGMRLSPNDIQQLEMAGIGIDGMLSVTTDAKVIDSNAGSQPRLFGLLGGYDWTIKSLRDPAPHMELSLQ